MINNLGKRTLIMGVLNITPDSFSDGGLYLDSEVAIARAVTMVEEGVDIIDIGGESTRPATFKDKSPLDPEEELRRILPVIKAVSQEIPHIPISVDTYKSAVAQRALDSGATIVNDISGLTFDRAMAATVAESGCPLIIMHMLGKPRQIREPVYGNVITDISTFFLKQIARALDAGVSPDNIVIDPGLGFGKTLEHNLVIIQRLSEFKILGFPIMIGPSRKRFLGGLLDDAPVKDRVEGTAAAVAIGIAHGAAIVRVHDVKPIVRVARVTDAIIRAVHPTR